MQFIGKVWKDESHWLIEVEDLDVMTQGHTKADALVMLADAIETLVDNPTFKVFVTDFGSGQVGVSSNDSDQMLSFFLRRQRESRGLSTRDVAKKMGSNSPNAYAQYEQGKRAPSFSKFDLMYRAITGQTWVISSKLYTKAQSGSSTTRVVARGPSKTVSHGYSGMMAKRAVSGRRKK